MDKYKFITGPINLVRLEGKIDNINKVIYVFYDIHNDITNQKQCANINAIAINTLLLKIFKKTTKQYDFFMEVFSQYYMYPDPPKLINTVNYIQQLSYLFENTTDFDYKKNKVKQSKFPNVRLHYADIREKLLLQPSINQQFKFSTLYIHELNYIFTSNFNAKNYDIIIDSLNIIMARNNIIYKLLFNENIKKKHIIPRMMDTFETIQKYTDKDIIDIVEFIIHKIKDDYTHEHVKKNINEFLIQTLKPLFKTMYDSYVKLIESLDIMKLLINPNKLVTIDNVTSYSKEFFVLYQNVIYIQYDIFGITFAQIYVNIMDAYAMRRILDKDYVTTSISYTGADHSNNYVAMLVKLFDFKITHNAYSKYPINETMKIINQTQLSDVKDKLPDLLFPEYSNDQCIDITNFPPLFS